MRAPTMFAIILTLLIAASHAAPPSPPSDPPPLPVLHYKAVLVAGDRETAAFDHATAAVRDRLLADHVPPADIHRLTASRAVAAEDGVPSSSLAHVLSAIAQLRPASGEGCFVFATSHGAPRDGLVLTPSENFLTPAALDRALVQGCGDAPTLVIISGCFSGTFAKPPMARANRVVLTAAIETRPSFGCGAGFEYTVYDRCLLEAMDRATVWRAAYAMIRACVSAREREFGFQASEPQAWFGGAVRGMPVPHTR
jgi:Peptidase C13 family